MSNIESRLQKVFPVRPIQSFFIVVALTFTTISYSANAAEPSAVGQGNNSLTFAASTADSRSQYLDLSPGINFGSSAFTIETYFKTGPSLDNGFFLGVGSGNGLSLNIYSPNEIQVDAFGINSTIFVLPITMQVNTWYHLAVARDASNNETVWLNGSRATSAYNRWDRGITYGSVFTDTRNYNGNSTGINGSTACPHCNQNHYNDARSNVDFSGVKITNFRVVVGSTVYDPNSATMAQRIMQYQAVIQLAQGAPQIYNLPLLHRQMIEVLGVKNADKLVPIDDDMTPRDPISENMAFLNGKPTKAFIYQDHDAHIAVHTSMMQDPMVMGQMGQNPMAQQMQAAIMAHVAEHIAFQYRTKIEQRLGATLPMPNTEMPEDIEVQLSKLVAQAAKQLLDINKNQAAQQQAQQQMQDPVVQMQQAELQIKQQDAQTKAQKVQGDLAIKQAELQLKMAQMQGNQGEDPAVAAQKAQQDIAIDAMKKQAEMRMSEQQHQQQLEHNQQTQDLQAKQQLLQMLINAKNQPKGE